ncbi:2-oxoisovalerate dehydrogenase subunit alpha, mitochondrial [Psilocybe cubensis]|uniref:2-oxoisovalerate dehydrogenase subunit alpha, mitochondrial n=1 Tax=Psilocybe cubensis TaxID=181762 RepID=A0ACB8GYA1_PSICU|nr:2-oxoisovalerate dehydrogenase subunit alpha, mitochondrial [Psilocybe cubensis]KAH9480623.1 2-oxoisovalerate dehydrogenase subunit alpha, mitochondrial [Psilocybe cubensis]
MIRTELTRSTPAFSRAFSRSYTSRRDLLPTTQSPIITKLDFFNSVGGKDNPIPTYRLIDGVGKPLQGAQLPDIDKDYARKLYEHMQLLPTLDNVLYNVQRQGKISFYYGEEATIIGSAAALEKDDE